MPEEIILEIDNIPEETDLSVSDIEPDEIALQPLFSPQTMPLLSIVKNTKGVFINTKEI